MVACGASSGFAAAFYCPISGIIFSVELLLPLITTEATLALMVSTSISVIFANYCFDEIPYFPIHNIGQMTTYVSKELPLYLLLGIGIGIFAAFFLWILEWFEEKLEKIGCGPYLKHGISMLIVGVILYFTNILFGNFYVEGAGYGYILKLLDGRITGLNFLLSLFFLKMIVTVLTLGSGGSGGIFAPSIFMGGCLGASFHIIAAKFYPSLQASQLDFILGGMIGMMSGVTGVVLTSITMMLEMTQSFYSTLPIIIIVCSTLLSRSILVKDSMYDSALKKKIFIER